MKRLTTISALISQLLAIPKYGQGIGLHRLDYLLKQSPIQPWVAQVNAIKVTGSNGKGSVCSMVSAILQEAGFQVGLYTSPHLFRFNERFCIDGSPISDRDLQAAGDWMFQTLQTYQHLHPEDYFGAFEVFTGMALYHFATQGVNAVVSEAGIGGRFDSTRMIPGHTTAITSLDLEHTQILGTTLEQIAYDKADLCPSGGLLVVGPLEPGVGRRLQVYCALRNVTLLQITEHCSVSKPRYQDDLMTFDLHYRDLTLRDLQLKLLGHHQVHNAAIAIVLAEQWLRGRWPQAGLQSSLWSSTDLEAIIRRALCALSVPGRFHKVWEQPEIYVDGGHTPHAMAQLVCSVQQLWVSQPILLVTGVSYNKDVTGMMAKLAPLPTQAICTRAWHRGGPVRGVAEGLSKCRPELPICCCETVEEAVELAIDLGRRHQMKVLVTGGLFLAAEVIQLLRGEDPQALQFF
jgi:dihydrofolate synthase/folylpolyglutamate synthase